MRRNRRRQLSRLELKLHTVKATHMLHHATHPSTRVNFFKYRQPVSMNCFFIIYNYYSVFSFIQWLRILINRFLVPSSPVVNGQRQKVVHRITITVCCLSLFVDSSPFEVADQIWKPFCSIFLLCLVRFDSCFEFIVCRPQRSIGYI